MTFLALVAVGRFSFRRLEIVLAVLVIEIVVALAARVLILEPGSAFAEHAEIVIRELEIIFGLDSIARKLRVARHALVFLEQLGGIAALAIVLPVPRLPAEVLTPLTPTAAPAAALTIVDQMPTPFAVVACPLGSSVEQGRAEGISPLRRS